MLAKAIAAYQWEIDHPQEQVILDNPYREPDPLGLEKERADFLALRKTLWLERFDRIGKRMGAVETFTCGVILFMAVGIGHMHSLLFSHWFDLGAVPILVGLDQVRRYLVQDMGEDPSSAFYVAARTLFMVAGIACGFVLPLLAVLAMGFLFLGLPLMARRFGQALRYM